MAYCSECGTELEAGANFCTGCGADIESSATPAEDVEAPSSTDSTPVWPLAGLVVCWVVWVATFQAALAGNPIGGLAGLAIVVSLALLYVDASAAKEAGELEIKYPVAVPIAVLLLWMLALPAYVIYRVATR